MTNKQIIANAMDASDMMWPLLYPVTRLDTEIREETQEISAKDALEITEKYISKDHQKRLNKIFSTIKLTASSGKSFIIIDKTTPAVKDRLIKLGYKVEKYKDYMGNYRQLK